MASTVPGQNGSGCNVCNPALRAAVAQGYSNSFAVDGKDCARCGAPGRHRALAWMLDTVGMPLLRDLGLLGTARSLCAAPGHHERRLLEPFMASLVTFSLFGKYGEEHIACDIRDLSRFESASFDLFEASLVFDYVPELALAIENVARVLAAPSAFFIHIKEGRLLQGNASPRVARTTTRKGGLPAYYPEEFERPQIVVGRKWFATAWRAHGFEVSQVVWQDPSIQQPFTWWVGVRRAQKNPQEITSRGFDLLRRLRAASRQ
jgi:SAM-dependent methyltransferase